VIASVDYRWSPETSFGGGIGAGIGGLIAVDGSAPTGAPSMSPRRFLVLPGWEVTLSYSHRFLDGRGRAPFLLLGVAGGASGAMTREEVYAGPTPAPVSLYAFDVRAGLTVGKTFWNTLSPYAVVRAFGGPVLWKYDGKSVNGTDRYHFQVGAGLVTALPRDFDVFVEGVPLGERALTLGLGKAL